MFNKNRNPNAERAKRPETSGSNLGLDCRYQLSSHLPRDTILAFEDVFDEVQEFRQSVVDDDDDDGATRMFEMCTLLSSHWVYAFAQGDRELYILMDPALFVTVADVENATRDVRYELFGHEPTSVTKSL